MNDKTPEEKLQDALGGLPPEGESAWEEQLRNDPALAAEWGELSQVAELLRAGKVLEEARPAAPLMLKDEQRAELLDATAVESASEASGGSIVDLSVARAAPVIPGLDSQRMGSQSRESQKRGLWAMAAVTVAILALSIGVISQMNVGQPSSLRSNKPQTASSQSTNPRAKNIATGPNVADEVITEELSAKPEAVGENAAVANLKLAQIESRVTQPTGGARVAPSMARQNMMRDDSFAESAALKVASQTASAPTSPSFAGRADQSQVAHRETKQDSQSATAKPGMEATALESPYEVADDIFAIPSNELFSDVSIEGDRQIALADEQPRRRQAGFNRDLDRLVEIPMESQVGGIISPDDSSAENVFYSPGASEVKSEEGEADFERPNTLHDADYRMDLGNAMPSRWERESFAATADLSVDESLAQSASAATSAASSTTDQLGAQPQEHPFALSAAPSSPPAPTQAFEQKDKELASARAASERRPSASAPASAAPTSPVVASEKLLVRPAGKKQALEVVQEETADAQQTGLFAQRPEPWIDLLYLHSPTDTEALYFVVLCQPRGLEGASAINLADQTIDANEETGEMMKEILELEATFATYFEKVEVIETASSAVLAEKLPRLFTLLDPPTSYTSDLHQWWFRAELQEQMKRTRFSEPPGIVIYSVGGRTARGSGFKRSGSARFTVDFDFEEPRFEDAPLPLKLTVLEIEVARLEAVSDDALRTEYAAKLRDILGELRIAYPDETALIDSLLLKLAE